jgi:hypothetical protein
LGKAAALSLTRREARDSTRARIPSKQIQTKPSKTAWICLDLFVRIGTFQRVTREKIKKIDSRLKLCAKRLNHAQTLVHPTVAAERGRLDRSMELD